MSPKTDHPFLRELPLRAKNAREQTFAAACNFLTRTGRYVGIFPATNDGFKYLSLWFLYSVVVTSGVFVVLMFCVIKVSIIGLLIDKSGGLVFYLCGTACVCKLVATSKSWKIVLDEWTDCESTIRRYGVLKLKRRFRLHATVYCGLALCEHLLFVANNIELLLECSNSRRLHVVELYFSMIFPEVFSLVQYDHFRGAAHEVVNLYATFAWNYSDLMLMLLSSALALMYREINARLRKGKTHESYWQQVRSDYVRVRRLNTVFDRHFSGLLSVSCSTNVLVLCVQLYNILKPRNSVLHSVYFFYSFGFVFGRLMGVVIFAAWINDECKETMSILHSVPSNEHNVEVYRFVECVQTQPAGVSISNLMLVNRNFLFKIAGTITTMELLLLQFGPLLQAKSEQVNTDTLCKTT